MRTGPERLLLCPLAVRGVLGCIVVLSIGIAHARPVEAAADRTPPRIVAAPTKGWKARGEIHEVTPRFRTAYEKARSGDLEMAPGARKLVVLLVPGVGGNQVPGYYRSVQRHLGTPTRSRPGYAVQRAVIHTLDDVDVNAIRIADDIEGIVSGGNDVLVVTHSMGGPYALAAEALRPSIRQHVRARVLQQPADGGVPGAWLLDNPVARTGLRLAGARGGLPKDLSPHTRRSVTALKPHDLSIPTLVLASSADHGVRGLIGRTLNRRPTRRKEGDGMVPTWSQLIRGTHAVILDDMDHGEPVVDLPGRHYDSGPLAEAMIDTAMRLPRSR